MILSPGTRVHIDAPGVSPSHGRQGVVVDSGDAACSVLLDGESSPRLFGASAVKSLEPRWRRAVKRRAADLLLAALFAAFGLVVADLTQFETGSVRAGTLAGLVATVVAVRVWVLWFRRRQR